MEKDLETVTSTEEEIVVEETTVETKDGSPAVGKTDEGKTDYVKHRVERAKEQTQKSLLKELGVDNLETAKELISSGKTALEEVMKLKNKLEEKEMMEKLTLKRNALIKSLEAEKVFDSEALANYVDLDKVEVVDGEIQDKENIIASLKKAKPNFFGTHTTVTDGYIKGGQVAPKTALDKQKEGNTVGAINDYLKAIIK